MKLSLGYFTAAKGILDGSFASNRKRRRFWWRVIALNVLAIVRGAAILFASVADFDVLISWQPDFDLLQSKLSKDTFQLMLVCFLCLFIFSVYLTHFFYHGVCNHHRIIPFIEDLNIVNSEAVYHENRARFDRLLTIKNHSSSRSWLVDFGHLLEDLVFPHKSTLKRRLSFRQKLPSVPITSPTVRGRLFAIVAANEFLSKANNVLMLVILSFLAFQFFVYVVGCLSIVWILYCVVDYICLSILCFNLLKMATIIIGLVNTTQFGLYNTLAMINKHYRKIVDLVSRDHRKQSTMFLPLLTWTTKAHKDMIDYIFYNDLVYTRLFLIFFLTNAPINALLVLIIFFKSVDNQQLFVVIFAIQIIGSIFAVVPLALNTRLVHIPSKYFVPIQPRIVNSIGDKWKCNARYEFIHSHKKIGYAVGPYGVATIKTLFEFVTIYIAFLLFLLKLMKRFEKAK